MHTNSEHLIHAIYRSSPVIRFCSRFNDDSPLWDYTRHKHPYFEFIYHLNGNVRRKTDDLTVQNANIFDTILYPVNCWHQDSPIESKGDSTHPLREVICIWADFPGILLEDPIKVQDHDGILEHLFSALYAESQKKSPSPELLSLQVRTLFLQILLLSQESPTTLVNHVIQYLHLHSADNISLDVLAEQEHISKSNLVKQFKAQTGTTIIAYLHEIRLNQVKKLLVTTNKSVEEIALSTGFDSPKYLYRLFKAQEGLSPNAYRRLSLTEHSDSIIT